MIGAEPGSGRSPHRLTHARALSRDVNASPGGSSIALRGVASPDLRVGGGRWWGEGVASEHREVARARVAEVPVRSCPILRRWCQARKHDPDVVLTECAAIWQAHAVSSDVDRRRGLSDTRKDARELPRGTSGVWSRPSLIVPRGTECRCGCRDEVRQGPYIGSSGRNVVGPVPRGTCRRLGAWRDSCPPGETRSPVARLQGAPSRRMQTDGMPSLSFQPASHSTAPNLRYRPPRYEPGPKCRTTFPRTMFHVEPLGAAPGKVAG